MFAHPGHAPFYSRRQQVGQYDIAAVLFNQRRLWIAPMASTLLALDLDQIGGEVFDG